MKNELLKLYEGSPTSFVESIKSKLEEKALEQIAEDVNAIAAQSVFNEGFKQDWQDLTNWHGSQNYALGQKVASLPKEKKKGLFDRFKKKKPTKEVKQ
jgi:hypothetical protein